MTRLRPSPWLAPLVVLGACLSGCDGCAGSPHGEPDAEDASFEGQLDAAADAAWEDLYCEGCADNDDQDSDGDEPWECGTDCDEMDPDRRGGIPDVAGDGFDADCSGTDGQDWDRDGYFAAEQGGDDCDDVDATVRPDAPDNQGWTVLNAPFSGNVGSIALVGSGVPVLTGGPGPGCPFDGDGDGIAESVDEAEATAVDVAFRSGGGWWVLDPWAACVTSRIDVATTRLLAHVLFGTVQDDGTGIFVRRRTSPGWTPFPPQSFEATDRRADGSIGLHDCNDEAALFVSQDGSTLVVRPIFDAGRLAQLDPVPSRGGDLEFDALAVPSAVYIIADGEDSESVRLARNRPGWFEQWTVRTIWGPTPQGEIFDVDLAFSPDRRQHVALLAADGVHVLVPSDAGVEDRLIAPMAEDAVARPSTTIAIAFDHGSALHLAWVAPALSPAHGEIRYATDRSGAWEVETVGVGDGWADLALDPHDNPHLSWHTEQRGAEPDPHPGRYATFSPIDGIDENCDGVDGVDADGDGHASRDTGGDDPDDTSPAR